MVSWPRIGARRARQPMRRSRSSSRRVSTSMGSPAGFSTRAPPLSSRRGTICSASLQERVPLCKRGPDGRPPRVLLPAGEEPIMMSPMPLLPERTAWSALRAHYATIATRHLRELFAEDPTRGESLALEAAGIYLDYSKNRITPETIDLLVRLAEEAGLRDRIDDMFRGSAINVSERRSVLHVALRAPRGASIVIDGKNVVAQVHATLDRMHNFANRVRSGEWTGRTGRPIRNVVNIGIGGSDLGPVMAYEALRFYSDRTLTFRFVSNVDGTDLVEALRDLDPAETLF